MVGLTNTKLQIGKGKVKEHASHIHPASASRDNIRSLIIKHISTGGGIDPTHRKILQAKGAQPNHIQWLEQTHLKWALKNIFNEFWPPAPSIFSNTEWEEKINETTLLPHRYNQCIDRTLENLIRKPLECYLPLLMKQQVTPEIVTYNMYCLFRGHFDISKANITKKIRLIDKCTKLLSELFTQDLKENDFFESVHKYIAIRIKVSKAEKGCGELKLNTNIDLCGRLKNKPDLTLKDAKEILALYITPAQKELDEFKVKLEELRMFVSFSMAGLRLPESNPQSEEERKKEALEAIKPKQA